MARTGVERIQLIGAVMISRLSQNTPVGYTALSDVTVMAEERRLPQRLKQTPERKFLLSLQIRQFKAFSIESRQILRHPEF